MLIYALTIFVSAFLLFVVQPLLGKFILPWFGGTPGVWTTAMLFFQTALLGGYLYAHLLSRWLRPRSQGLVHAALLLLSLALLPIAPNARWQPRGDESPAPLIIRLLAVHVGIPYLLLASTNPLLQSWFHRRWSRAVPYRLYSLSNLASLLALLAFPFLIEPSWTSTQQSTIWSIGYAGFVCLAIGCAIQSIRVPASPQPLPSSEFPVAPDSRPRFGDYALWLALSGCGAVLFLSTTNFVCLDIAVVPLLWVIPLAIYLLSFVIVFDNPRWYSRKLTILVLALLFTAPLLRRSPSIIETITYFFALLFVTCLMVHGELARSKPAPRHLTAFYLMSAAGGALGGAFVALLCPLIFLKWSEWPLAMLLAFLLTLIAMLRADGWTVGGAIRPRAAKSFMGFLLVAAVALTILVDRRGKPTDVARNFFGIVKVLDGLDPDGRPLRKLVSGRICHGLQYQVPELHLVPTAYYAPRSGAGRTLRSFDRPAGRNIAVIGLGAGMLTVYGNERDRFTFYEINPAVVDMAREWFTYLDESRARVDIVLGDARLALQHVPAATFDILIVDAFSGDAIPVHLLTREAFDLYLNVLKPDGVLLVHISNQYLNLFPVLARAAEHFHLDIAMIRSEPDPESTTIETEFVILTRNRAFLSHPEIAPAITPAKDRANVPLWTDNRNNLLDVLR